MRLDPENAVVLHQYRIIEEIRQAVRSLILPYERRIFGVTYHEHREWVVRKASVQTSDWGVPEDELTPAIILKSNGLFVLETFGKFRRDRISPDFRELARQELIDIHQYVMLQANSH